MTTNDDIALLTAINGDLYKPDTNPTGLNGRGGPAANIVRTFNAVGRIANQVATWVATVSTYIGRLSAAVPIVAAVWDTSTADANAGTGKVWANSGNASTTTILYISVTDADGVDISSSLAALGAGTSAIKGRLRIVSAGSPSQYRDYVVTGVTAAAGYYKVSVTWLAGTGALTGGTSIGIGWTVKGDKGDTGPQGSVWYAGSGAPASGLGVDGDRYHRTSNGDVYLKAAGSWGIPYANIKGADGANGSNGVNGAGPVWYGTSTGSANAQVLAGPLASLTGNPSIEWIAGYTNTSTIVNLTVGSAPQARLKDATGADPAVGAVVANTKYVTTYDGTYWRLAGGGFSNPMTTAGSLIYGGIGGIPQQRTIGPDGSTLYAFGGVPIWAPFGAAPSWRVLANAATGDPGIQWNVREIEMMEDIASAIDLCVGGTVIATSLTFTGGGNPGNAFDDNTGTQMYSSYSGAANNGVAWIGYRFAVPRAIRKLRIYPASGSDANVASIKIQKSFDEIVWGDVGIFSPAPGTWNTFTW